MAITQIDLRTGVVTTRDLTPEEISALPTTDKAEEYRNSRQSLINNIKVTVDSMIFDGNEKSQTRMTNTIACLPDTETIEWILADNTKARVTKEQLQQALKLSVMSLSEIWTKEITNE